MPKDSLFSKVCRECKGGVETKLVKTEEEGQIKKETYACPSCATEYISTWGFLSLKWEM